MATKMNPLTGKPLGEAQPQKMNPLTGKPIGASQTTTPGAQSAGGKVLLGGNAELPSWDIRNSAIYPHAEPKKNINDRNSIDTLSAWQDKAAEKEREKAEPKKSLLDYLAMAGSTSDTSIPVQPRQTTESDYLSRQAISGAINSVKGAANYLAYLGQGAMRGQQAKQQASQQMDAALTGNKASTAMADKLKTEREADETEGLKTYAHWGEGFDKQTEKEYKPDASLQLAGNVVSGVSGMVPSIISNFILPGSGLYVMAAGAAGNATQEAKDAGADDAAALTYGTAVGIVEAATEKMFDGVSGIFGKGAADDVIEKLVKSKVKNEAAQVAIIRLASVLGEGTEEFVSEIVNNWINRVTVDTDMRRGMELFGEAGYSFIVGGLTSAIMQGVSVGKAPNAQEIAEKAAEYTKEEMQSQRDTDFNETPIPMRKTIVPTMAELQGEEQLRAQNEYGRKLAKALKDFGVKNVIVETMPEGELGRWENGTVYISSALDTRQAINAKVGHEISHAAQMGDAAFSRDITQAMREQSTDVDTLIKNKQAVYSEFYRQQGKTEDWIAENITEDYAADEVTADYIGSLMEDEGKLQALASKPTLVQKIVNAINRLLGRNISEPERESYTRLAEKLRSIAGVEGTAKQNTAESGTRYSVERTKNIPYRKQIENYSELGRNDDVYVMDADSSLSPFRLGDKPFFMLKRNVNKATREAGNNEHYSSHSIDDETIKRVPEHLKDPALVVISNGRISVIADEKVATKKEKAAPLLIGINPNGSVDGMSANEIKTIFGVDEFSDWLKLRAKDSIILAGNENKAAALLRDVGLQLSEPVAYAADLTNRILSQGDEDVKTRHSLDEDYLRGLEESEAPQKRSKEPTEPWEETEVQAQKAGYPMLDGKQLYPYKSWVRDKERGNYGLVVGKHGTNARGEQMLTISFWNKQDGTRAKVDVPVTQLEMTEGKYQPSDAELTALFQSEPAESLRSAVSAKDWQGYRDLWDIENGIDPGTAVELTREELPSKAQDYMKRAENFFTKDLSGLLGVQRSRETLKPMVENMSEEFLSTGTVSDETLKEVFNKAWDNAAVINEDFYNEYKDLKAELRDEPVSISAGDAASIADFADWKKHQFGKLRISGEGTPVDIRYSELSHSYPDMFPESITHPADQLLRMAEVADSIKKTEESLDDHYGKDAEYMRAGAYDSFTQKAYDHLAELQKVRKYYERRAKDQTEAKATYEFAGKRLKDGDVEYIKEQWKELKLVKKEVDKAVRQNLMTDYDNSVVELLLRGKLTEDALPADCNQSGVLKVFEAKRDYEQAMGEINRFNKAGKAALRHEADSYLQGSINWKDKNAGILYERETMERNIRDIVKDKETADSIIRRYFEPVHKNEAERTKLRNSARELVKALELSRRQDKGNKHSEAEAVQILGEAMDNIATIEARPVKNGKRDDWRNGQSLTEWKTILEDVYKSNPNMDMDKVKNAIEAFRGIYDDLFSQMNDARIRNGYEPVDYRKGYFPHFSRTEPDTLLAKIGAKLGIKTQVDELPTSINGITHTFRPGTRWFGAALKRSGYDTTYDAVEGFDRYIEGVSDVIHHTDDIQSLRALADQIRYRSGDDGIREQIDAIRDDKNMPIELKTDAIREIYENGKFTLSNFISNLEEYTNLLANKKAFADRNMEHSVGRKSYDLVKELENRVAANMVAVNPGSWLTNFIPLTQGGAQLKQSELLSGMWDTLKAVKNDDGLRDTSTFLVNRRGSDPLVRTWQQAASATMSTPMSWIDNFTSETLIRARVKHNQAEGMSYTDAIDEADTWTAGVMADRSKGSMPVLFESKNPVTKLFTQFQLEVNNQLSYVFKDIPREQKDKGLAALVAALFKFALGAWMYNEVYEYFIGRRPALDPIGILNETVGDLTGYQLPNVLDAGSGAIKGEAPNIKTGKETLSGAGLNLAKNVAEDMPFIGGLLGGGRLPISSALPDAEKLWNAGANLISGEGDAGKQWATLGKEALKPATYLAPPFGGGQIKKIYQGIEAVIKGGSYSVDADGNDIMQYPVFNDTAGQTAEATLKSILFGKSSLAPAQDWVENGFKSFGAKETAAYQGMTDAGVPDKDAYKLLLDMRGIEKTDEESVAVQKRHKLQSADISGDGKSVFYYGILATDTERALMDELAGKDSNMGEVTEALLKIKDAGMLKGAEASNTKRDAIAAAQLSDEEKRNIYLHTFGEKQEDGTYTSGRQDDMETFAEMGLDFDRFLETQNAYTSINEDYDKASEKATEFSRWCNTQDFTAEQKAAIKECFTYYSQLPMEASTYDNLMSAGLSDEASYKLTGTLQGLEPLPGKTQVSDLQKLEAISNMGWGSANELSAAGAVVDDSLYQKLTIGEEQGVEVEDYVRYRSSLETHDADGNGNFTQKEVTAAIDSMKELTTSQKAALWQLQNKQWKAKNNPYSSAIGAQVAQQLAASTEVKQTASVGAKMNPLTGKPIGGSSTNVAASVNTEASEVKINPLTGKPMGG